MALRGSKDNILTSILLRSEDVYHLEARTFPTILEVNIAASQMYIHSELYVCMYVCMVINTSSPCFEAIQ